MNEVSEVLSPTSSVLGRSPLVWNPAAARSPQPGEGGSAPRKPRNCRSGARRPALRGPGTVTPLRELGPGPRKARAQGQSPAPAPPPLQVSRRAAAPAPRGSGGDVRPLDRAPAPPLQAAPGARDSAVAAGAAAGHAGCGGDRGRRGGPTPAQARPGAARGSRRGSPAAAAARPRPPRRPQRLPRRLAGARPASAVHLRGRRPIARRRPGRTSRSP